MAEARIPVDPFNPGQVFACIGFMEAAEILLGDTEGAFDWDGAAPGFTIRAPGGENPVAAVLGFLADAKLLSCAPRTSMLRTEKWDVITEIMADDVFPFPEPDAPAILPAVLRDRAGRQITLEHWGDATSRDAVKFWAGSGGYPGAAFARDALDLIRDHLATPMTMADPFSLSAAQSSSFRLDFRRDYIAIDAGFSPNDHKSRMTLRGYPLVELLAAIGLQSARPLRLDRLAYRYAMAAVTLPLGLMRAVLGCAPLPFPRRSFRMQLGWPGQEGQARCITSVLETPL